MACMHEWVGTNYGIACKLCGDACSYRDLSRFQEIYGPLLELPVPVYVHPEPPQPPPRPVEPKRNGSREEREMWMRQRQAKPNATPKPQRRWKRGAGILGPLPNLVPPPPPPPEPEPPCLIFGTNRPIPETPIDPYAMAKESVIQWNLDRLATQRLKRRIEERNSRIRFKREYEAEIEQFC